jgi:hypothetical protein
VTRKQVNPPQDVAGPATVEDMTGLEFTAWGLFGGFAVEGLEFSAAIRRTGRWPWRQPGEPGPLPFAISIIIRLGVGAGLAAAAGMADQISGPFGALAVGVAAPLVVEQLARQVYLTESLTQDGGTSDTAEPRSVTREGTDES